MNIAQLHQTYTIEQLSCTPGDGPLRYRIFAPLLQNLFESCVVYREGPIYAVTHLTELKLDADGFRARVEIRHRIPLSSRDFVWPERPWHFGSDWENARLIGAKLNAPYCGFTVWPDPALVEEVQRLAIAGQTQEIKRLLYPEET